MEKLALPPELHRMERFIGFTIPRHGRFHICDHDEVLIIDIGETITATLAEQRSYEFVENNADFVGLVFEGLTENEPILSVGSTSISYSFHPTAEFVVVTYVVGSQTGSIRFPLWSGAWFAASLSDDGAYLVLAEPSDISLYRLAEA